MLQGVHFRAAERGSGPRPSLQEAAGLEGGFRVGFKGSGLKVCMRAFIEVSGVLVLCLTSVFRLSFPACVFRDCWLGQVSINFSHLSLHPTCRMFLASLQP